MAEFNVIVINRLDSDDAIGAVKRGHTARLQSDFIV